MNGIWELPIGRDGSGLARRLLGGWQTGWIGYAASGQPLSLLAVNGFNANTSAGSGSGAANTPSTPIPVAGVPKNAGLVQRTGNGVIYFSGFRQAADPSIGNIATPAIRNQSIMMAVTDGSGQMLLVNPQPGQFGLLAPNFFEGPGVFRLDLNLIKRIRVTERVELQLRGDAVNATNSPHFESPVTDINSPNLGRINDTVSGSNRVIVVGFRVNW